MVSTSQSTKKTLSPQEITLMSADYSVDGHKSNLNLTQRRPFTLPVYKPTCELYYKINALGSTVSSQTLSNIRDTYRTQIREINPQTYNYDESEYPYDELSVTIIENNHKFINNFNLWASKAFAFEQTGDFKQASFSAEMAAIDLFQAAEIYPDDTTKNKLLDEATLWNNKATQLEVKHQSRLPAYLQTGSRQEILDSGIKQGEHIGNRSHAINTALTMLRDAQRPEGLSDAKIAEYTGLPLEEIEFLKTQI